MEDLRNQSVNYLKDTEIIIELGEIIKKPFLTQKEIILKEVLKNIPEDDFNKIVNGKAKDKNEKEKDSNEKDEEVSRLNPESEILTEKDPDEIIILPNEDLKKTFNRKNKNQPL